ncbi:hypothetical protein STEG23_001936, partial [Scotinomys teguina]
LNQEPQSSFQTLVAKWIVGKGHLRLEECHIQLQDCNPHKKETRVTSAKWPLGALRAANPSCCRVRADLQCSGSYGIQGADPRRRQKPSSEGLFFLSVFSSQISGLSCPMTPVVSIKASASVRWQHGNRLWTEEKKALTSAQWEEARLKTCSSCIEK